VVSNNRVLKISNIYASVDFQGCLVNGYSHKNKKSINYNYNIKLIKKYRKKIFISLIFSLINLLLI
jgi:hypothetical protein